MTPDELKAIPKGSFITMKTKFQLFLKWGITFGETHSPKGRICQQRRSDCDNF
jgi:hypothetical protein